MSRQHKVNLNNDLASTLERNVLSIPNPTRKHRLHRQKPGKRPDISITSQGRSPVIIKAEYMPAHNVEEKAGKVWKTAGRSHPNLDFRFNSQPLAVAFTEEPCIGGSAWPNVNFAKKSWDYAFSIWGNSTLGLLCYWWHATRQQPGRAIISITESETLPVLDFRALTQAQIKQAKAIFDRFKNKHFLPAYVADKDDTRRALDEAVLCEWLGFGKDVFKAVRQLASKWYAEPSVHGGKQRPQHPPL